MGIFLGATSVFLLWQYSSTQTMIMNNARNKAKLLNQKAALTIDARLKILSNTVNTIAQDLTTGKLAKNKIIDELEKKPAPIDGLGVAFSVYSYDKNTKLYAPYVISKDTKKTLIFLDKISDYTQPSDPRFLASINHEGMFHAPFFDPNQNSMVIEYSATFFDKDNKAIGIVFANYSLKSMEQITESAYSGQLAHGSIDTDKGVLVYDPMTELVEQKKTGPQVARDVKDLVLAEKLEKAIKGEINLIEVSKDWITGQKAWVLFDRMPTTSWYSIGIFIVDELTEGTTKLNRLFIYMLLSFIFFFIVFFSFLLAYYTQTSFKYALISCVISCGFVLGIALVWYNAFKKIPEFQSTGALEKSSFNISDIIKQFESASSPLPTTENSSGQPTTKSSNTNLTTIPTGIYIHELSVDIDKINLLGYVWQQVPVHTTQEINMGVIFPQATDIQLKQMYTFTDGNVQTTGWSVQCTLQQNFDYSRYPFDFRFINISLWPHAFNNDTLLTPDLDGYKVIYPVSLPGLNTRINEGDWRFHLSYFSYKKNNVSTDFGYHGKTTMQLPHLNFNIVANRYVTSTLILNLTPIIIILIMLFILLTMASLIEFSSMFGILASLFFTSLVAYTAFKSYLPIQQIVFFDYLYFTIQGIILTIAMIAILYYSKLTIPFIKYKHLLIPQLLFWPLVTGTILIMSLIFFY
jgi:hypothetical protein